MDDKIKSSSISFKGRWRVNLIFLLIGVAFLLLLYRLYTIQVRDHLKYTSIQKSQTYLKVEKSPKLGMIFDRNGELLAVSHTVDSAYAVPSELNEDTQKITLISDVLKIPAPEIHAKIKGAVEQQKRFVWLKRRITPRESKRLNSFNIKGIGFRQEYKRFYPQGKLACHLIGFRGMDEKALAGIELICDNYLLGESSHYLTSRDARQKNLSSELLLQGSPPSQNVYLTIDVVIQFIVEKALDQAYQKWQAHRAMAVVLNPQTGEILALANCPAFNPHQYNEYPAKVWCNYAISDPFEPGSTFKPFIACALLDQQRVTLHDKFFCQNGHFKVGHRLIHDHQPMGWLTFKEILTKSSNIGMAKVGLQLGRKDMYDYVKRFDFGKVTGVGLPGESSGLMTPYEQWNHYTITSIPMGHEIAVTALQLAKAYCVFANGGYLLKPQVIQKITDVQGRVVKKFGTELIRRVIKPETERQMRLILTEVVNTGTGTRAKLVDYQVAGKTGTAQKLDASGKYSRKRFNGLFLGFAPAESPQILVLVMLDEPKGADYGGTVAAPVVAQIIDQTLKYLRVPPSLVNKKTSYKK